VNSKMWQIIFVAMDNNETSDTHVSLLRMHEYYVAVTGYPRHMRKGLQQAYCAWR
jgi:hypothetical protein